MNTGTTSPASILQRLGLVAFAASSLATSAIAQGPGKLAYVADFEIWTMEADGTGKEALGLAATDFDAYDVQLSPSGEWLVFSGTDLDSGGSGLFLMRAEAYDDPGNVPELIGPDASFFKRASWHPGGGWVAYVGNDNKVYLVEALDGDGEPVGGTPETITDESSPVWVTDLAFAPDGRDLLVCQFDADLALIEVFDANGARTANVIDDPLTPLTDAFAGNARWPSFSPDGKRIVFHHWENDTEPPFDVSNAIAVLAIRDGSGALTPEDHSTNPRTFLTAPTTEPEGTPTWSPDGSKIAFFDLASYQRIVSIDATGPEDETTNPREELAGEINVDTGYPSFAHPGGGGGSAPSLPAPVPPNLISWWPGENAAWDVAGIGEGSMKNSEDFDPYDVGKVGRAFWFDGVDDHIQGRSGGMSLVQNFSIEAWVRPLSHSAEQTIIAKGNGADSDVSYSLLLRDGKPYFRSSMGGVEHEFGPNDPIYQGDTTLPLDEWSHLALVSGDSFFRMYLNGEIIGGADPVVRPTTTGPVTIGAFIDDAHPTETPGSPFDGLIDELSLYDRKLSQTEIGLIFQAGAAGKARHDPARDFSATSNPKLPWRYGWIDGPGTVVPSRVTGGDINFGGLFAPPAILEDTTYVYGTEPDAHLLFNKSKTDRATFAGGDGMTTTTIDIAPRQFAFHPSDDGDYTLLHWTAPEAGEYALSATFTGVEDSPSTTDVHLYRGDTELFTGSVNTFLGDGASVTEDASLSEGDTVSWVVGGGAAAGLDYTGVVASAVKLDEYETFARPEFNGSGLFGYKPPLMNGKTVRFEGRNTDRADHPSMTGRIQYSATPGIPGSWIDLPGGAMTNSSPTSQTFFLTTSSLPVGTFAFRIATTATGPFGLNNEVIEATTFSAPSDMFTVLAAGPHYEVELDVSSASDPTGVTTHRGDTLTYRARFRNSGGATVPVADRVQILVRVPDGTSVAAGSTPGYTIVNEGGLNFARWTLTKPLLPVDPEPVFTVLNATTETILSDAHNLEEGDLIQVYTDGTIPGGLATRTDYQVVSPTTNTFKLALPGSTAPVDLQNSGSGTHRFERLWQTRTLKLTVADPTAAQETSVDDLDFGDILATVARITDRFHPGSFITDSDLELTTIINPLSLTAGPPVPAVAPLKQGGELHVDFTVKNEASYPMDNAFLRVQAPEGLTILGGTFATGSQVPAPQLTETGSAFLSEGELLDAEALLTKLSTPADGVSAFLSTRIEGNLLYEFGQWQTGTEPSGKLRFATVEFLNQLLQGSSLWDPTRFAGITLRPATIELRNSNPTGTQLIELNRMLLEDAYPTELLRYSAANLGSQVLIFETGPLAPGGTRVCRAEFRVQYDLNLAALPFFDFDPEEPEVGNAHEDLRRAIEFSHATASTVRPSLTSYVKKAYKKKVRKVIKRRGKKPIIRFVPVTKYRLVPVNYVRNGIEANLEEEFGLEVLEGPRSPDYPFPRINVPSLDVSMGQEAAGFVPGTDRAVITQSATPIPGASPARKTNQIRYKVTYRNSGDVRAEFIRVWVPIPEEMTYVNGSAKYEKVVGDLTEPSAPAIIGNSLIFNLQYLEPSGTDGSEKSFSFLAQLKPNVPLDTVLNQPGAVIISRDLDQPASVYHTMEAKVSRPARMSYSRPERKTLTDGDGNLIEIHHQIKYENVGETVASDVELRYTIPEGLVLVDADILDIEGDRILKSLDVIKPTLPDREVVFPIGTVSRSVFDINGNWVPGAGWARVRLAKDEDHPPVQPPLGEDGYRTDGGFRPSDSTTPQNSASESAVAESEAEYGVPTSIAEGNVFIGVRGPHYMYRSTVGAPSEITYQVTWGSALHRTPGAGGVIFPIPPGTTYVTHSGAQGLHGQGAGHSGNHNESNEIPGYPYEHVAWAHNISGGSKAEFATVTVRVNPGFAGPVVCEGAYISGDQAGIRHALPGRTNISDTPNLHEIAARSFGSFSEADEAFLQIGPNKVHAKMKLVDVGSTWFALGGADAFVIADNIVINIGDGKIVAAGGGNIVAGGGGNIVAGGGGNIVAGGGGNIVAGGGGNIVAGGGGNIQVRMADGNMMSVTDIFANIRSIVAGGGGNIVAGGGLNLVRYVVANDGAGIKPGDVAAKGLVGLDGASLIGLDGASVIATVEISNFSTGEMRLLDPQNIQPPQVMLAGAQAMLAMGGESLQQLVYAPEAGDGGLVIDGDAMNLHSAQAVITTMGSPFLADGGSTLVGQDGASLAAKGAAIIGEHGAGIVAEHGSGLISKGGAGVLSHNGNAFRVGAGLRTGGGN